MQGDPQASQLEKKVCPPCRCNCGLVAAEDQTEGCTKNQNPKHPLNTHTSHGAYILVSVLVGDFGQVTSAPLVAPWHLWKEETFCKDCFWCL